MGSRNAFKNQELRKSEFRRDFVPGTRPRIPKIKCFVLLRSGKFLRFLRISGIHADCRHFGYVINLNAPCVHTPGAMQTPHPGRHALGYLGAPCVHTPGAMRTPLGYPVAKGVVGAQGSPVPLSLQVKYCNNVSVFTRKMSLFSIITETHFSPRHPLQIPHF